MNTFVTSVLKMYIVLCMTFSFKSFSSYRKFFFFFLLLLKTTFKNNRDITASYGEEGKSRVETIKAVS